MTTKTAFTIQPVLAPDFGRPDELFTNVPEAAPTFVSSAPWDLRAGHSIETNTYLNALFPHTWRHHADIGDIGVKVVSSGQFSITIFAIDADENEIFCKKQTFDVKRNEAVTLWLDEGFESCARLYFRLTANEELSIEEMGWVTDRAPRHEPSLSVGLCTFNRETELSATLSALNSQKQKTPSLKTIWVINQGPSFTDQRLIEEIKKPDIRSIEQPNLGGCGGFTRSMFEAVSAKDQTSHHLLMDDDIILDPRLIDKVLHFLRYSDQSFALGGQMLEIENPTRLFEAGGKVHHRNFVEPVGKDQDISDPAALSMFSSRLEIDYNAWWFCVLPTVAIKSVGLPPPLFIRGDDIEYGFRLKAAGIETIPLPGCPVWHESFSHKTSDWLNYYVLRNRLFFSVIYPHATRRPDSLFLFGFLMTLLLVHRYRAASVALQAIKDASSDPIEALASNSAEKHKELNALLASLPAAPLLKPEDLVNYKTGKTKPLNTTVPAMAFMIVRAFVLLHMSRLNPWRKTKVFEHMPQAPAVGGADYYGALDKEQSEFSYYKSDLGKLWSLTFKTLTVCLRHGLLSHKKTQKIRDQLEALRHPDHWQKAFNAPRD